MSIRRCTLSVVLLSLSAGTALAQAGQPHPLEHAGHPGEDAVADTAAVEALVLAARAATQRYHDRAAAIADGFRLLGPDFPAMGEHWVNPGRMVDGTLDVSRPQALSYATIAGRPVLLGVIYARPLRADEPPPSFPVAGYPWHDHVGAIDEESVLLHHVPTSQGSSPGVRLAMLHAWVWTDNPDGIFAADNWALPFMRLNLEAPAGIPRSAARALSLISGGDAYYTLLFRALAAPTAEEEATVQELIRRTRARVEAWYAARTAGDARLHDGDLLRLSQLWTSLWSDASGVVPPASAARLGLLVSP
jgi:hypothetical protein